MIEYMNLLLLSGNSKRNKEWIHRVGEALSDSFSSTLVHHYRHWDSGEEFIDLDYELGKVVQEAQNLKSYSIFAKSVGSILALKGTVAQLLQPSSIIITGLPLSLIETENIPVLEWFKKIRIPITIAQNNQDPLGSYDEVKKFAGRTNRPGLTIVKLTGNTHDYEDMGRLKELARNSSSL